jgi:hypothetical protein
MTLHGALPVPFLKDVMVLEGRALLGIGVLLTTPVEERGLLRLIRDIRVRMGFLSAAIRSWGGVAYGPMGKRRTGYTLIDARSSSSRSPTRKAMVMANVGGGVVGGVCGGVGGGCGGGRIEFARACVLL